MVWHYTFEGQVLAMIVVTLLVICMLVNRRYIESNVGYKVEVLNEVCVIALSCIMIGYAMCVGDGRALNLQGWIHIGFFLFTILVNFIVFLYKGCIN